ncbi:hypothetical protein HUU05_19755 [candidate division KSB1 bacterium]|nr:hypothetical protein [candidate division KSB1 bacterium]
MPTGVIIWRENLCEDFAKGELAAGHARALLGVPGEAAQLEAWKKILKDQLTVRQVEKMAQEAGGDKKGKKKKSKPSLETPSDIREVEDSLRRIFGTQVRIQKKGEGGVIEMEFYSAADLERLLELMQHMANF